MSLTILEGPTIAGKPDGYPRYWTVRKTKNTVWRLKPVDLLANPTTYSNSTVSVRTRPDSQPDYPEMTPQYGSVGVNPQAHFEINQMEIVLATLSDARVLAKIKNEKWSLGVFMAELPATQRHLMTLIPRMVSVYVAFKKRLTDPKWWKTLVKRGKRFAKKRKLRKIQKDAGAIARLWLEFRYAIMPLAYDLQDMLTYLYDSVVRPRIFRASSGATDSWSSTFRGGVLSPATSVMATCQVRTVCYYTASADADALKRLGLINLPAILWELTPLSFVADMVLPIGDFIGNLDAMVGVSVVSTTRSTRLDMVDIRSDLTYYTTKYGGSEGTGKFYKRSVIPAPVNHPRFTKSATGKQLCDIIALSRTIVFK